MNDFEMVTRNTSEVVTPGELTALLKQETKTAYIGFEPSGFVHLGWVTCANKIMDLQRAGFKVTILLADWHAWINDKLNGDLKLIHHCAEYMKDCFKALGVTQVSYVYAKDFAADPRYWEQVITVAKNTSLSRVRRAMDIMGRRADEIKDLSKFLYPAMQVADIFYLGVDLAYGGMDQRHAHMLCRDVATKMKKKKPVALHTPLICSLIRGGRMDTAKMSKSKPESCIFIHDEPPEIKQKILKAYCPEGIVEENPLLEIIQHIIFPWLTKPLSIDRKKEYGGPLHYTSYTNLEADYQGKKIHPLDIKNTVADYLIQILQPVRDYFAQNPNNLKKLHGEYHSLSSQA
ncbi:MAG: tyrosine--tRNA ligase [Candidatus Aminicenantes bacterium]|nr:tyrosine--tRNA ligase [Candidatus Aminicenantes bacterium]